LNKYHYISFFILRLFLETIQKMAEKESQPVVDVRLSDAFSSHLIMQITNLFESQFATREKEFKQEIKELNAVIAKYIKKEEAMNFSNGVLIEANSKLEQEIADLRKENADLKKQNAELLEFS
jgi:hypothetical protein